MRAPFAAPRFLTRHCDSALTAVRASSRKPQHGGRASGTPTTAARLGRFERQVRAVRCDRSGSTGRDMRDVRRCPPRPGSPRRSPADGFDLHPIATSSDRSGQGHRPHRGPRSIPGQSLVVGATIDAAGRCRLAPALAGRVSAMWKPAVSGDTGVRGLVAGPLLRMQDRSRDPVRRPTDISATPGLISGQSADNLYR